MSRQPAVNAYQRTITEYGSDPRQGPVLGLFNDVWARAQGRRVKAYRQDQSDPSQSFYGWGPQLQQFTGTGAANSIVYKDPAANTLANAQGDIESIDDPTMRILADRLRRRQT